MVLLIASRLLGWEGVASIRSLLHGGKVGKKVVCPDGNVLECYRQCIKGMNNSSRNTDRSTTSCSGAKVDETEMETSDHIREGLLMPTKAPLSLVYVAKEAVKGSRRRQTVGTRSAFPIALVCGT